MLNKTKYKKELAQYWMCATLDGAIFPSQDSLTVLWKQKEIGYSDEWGIKIWRIKWMIYLELVALENDYGHEHGNC